MDEKKPGRWLAIWPRHMPRERFEWELPFVGTVQNDEFYHYGGMTRMGFSPEDVVLKDYGKMTIEEWDEQGGDDQWYADFPPVASPAEEYDAMVESWISPEGDIYLCNHEQHEMLAIRLCKRFGIEEPDSSLNRPGDLVETRGWVKLFFDKFLYSRSDLTQKQLDALFDIYLVLQKKDEAHSLCESLREVLRIEPREPEPETEPEPYEPSMTPEEIEAMEGDFHAFQRQWLGFVPDECPTAAELDELNAARSELLDTICAAVEQRGDPEPEPERDPEPELVVAVASGSRSEHRPFVLTDQPYVEITVRAYCTTEDLGDGRRRGISCFKTFCTTVSGDDGDDYGMIGGGTGFVTLSDHRRNGFDREEHFIRHRDLWYAYQQALNTKYGTDYPESEESEERGR